MNEFVATVGAILILSLGWLTMLSWGAFDNLISRRKRILDARKWDD